MKRSALVVAGHRARTHRWLPGVLLVLGLVAGTAATGWVLGSDPVGYGVAFWPFADSADQAEKQLMALVSASARSSCASDCTSPRARRTRSASRPSGAAR
ncbi:MAG TPA: hypothetical protein VGP03_13745 [Pseudonocardiaceae bacterium]|nr:hypothetical protein [Pseudonocardiaceae bacterium]